MPIETPLIAAVPLLKRHAKALDALGISTLGDVLRHLPFRYEDYSRTVPLSQVVPGEDVTVRVRLEQIRNRRSFFGPRRVITEGLVADASGKARVLWFGQFYLTKTHLPGSEVFLAGRAKRTATGLQFVSPTIEAVRAEQTHTGRIVPVYATSGTLSVKHLRLAAKAALPVCSELCEWLPEEVRSRLNLMDFARATRTAHFPPDQKTLDAALERLAVGDLFLRVLVAERSRAEVARTRAVPVPFPEAVIKSFVAGLPFALTDGQRRAAWDALKDMARERPMHRLLNGDVGSGKTAVAAIAARAVAAAGGQTAVLVPTEVLAEQHLRTFTAWFAGSGVGVEMLTSGMRAAAKDAARAAIASGQAQIVIGTQALLEDAVAFRDLRLAVVDEQHRFGVRQRQALHRKRVDGALPHLLSLTATPIPRTLSLAVFGDLDVSVIPARPAGRMPIATEIAGAARADEAVAATVAALEQAFVVCPAIDERPESGREAVVAEHRRLQKLLPDAHVALIHGKLKPAEKRAVMERFAAGAPGVLVSTTVIEVGIDLPRATLMVVRSAERFGLAQLHQLRGRVGRGALPGRCLLVTESEAPPAAARLQALVSSSDGFALAEEDLRLRGPGDVLGTVQSGMQAAWNPALLDPKKIAVLQEESRALLAGDPAFARHPELAAVFFRFEQDIHRE